MAGKQSTASLLPVDDDVAHWVLRRGGLDSEESHQLDEIAAAHPELPDEPGVTRAASCSCDTVERDLTRVRAGPTTLVKD